MAPKTKPAVGKPVTEMVAPSTNPKVFISWSGVRSKPAAEAFRDWLAKKVSVSNPWVSSADIPHLGTSEWREELFRALDSAQICVSFLTVDNQHAPWLHFEAGALALRMRHGAMRIALVLLDLEPKDVEEPLVAYNLTRFTKDALCGLVVDINARVGNPSYAAAVKDSFETDWPDLEMAMKPPPTVVGNSDQPKRDPENILAEILEKVRTMEQSIARIATDRGERVPTGFSGGISARSIRSDPAFRAFAEGLIAPAPTTTPESEAIGETKAQFLARAGVSKEDIATLQRAEAHVKQVTEQDLEHQRTAEAHFRGEPMHVSRGRPR